MAGWNNLIHKTKVSKTLLTLTLLFSLFAFSGSESRSPAQSSGIARTEWVASRRVNAKRILSFTQTPSHFINSCFSKTGLLWAVRLKTNLVKTEMKQLANLEFSISPIAQFLYSRTIPQDKEEDQLICV